MTQRKPFIAGNWKMNKTVSESVEFAQALHQELGTFNDVDVLIAPTSIAIYPVIQAIGKDSVIKVASQNVYPQPSGAYTGELSAPMLKAADCHFSLVGHSERRQIFQENDEFLNLKLKALLQHDIQPIFCIGESLEEREAEQTFDKVSSQIINGLKDISKENLLNITLAYEPIWAIGTGKTASPKQAQEVHQYLRQEIAKLYDQEIADKIRILYGGSVKPNNVKELMQQPDIDGALVGGASLKVDSFLKLIRFNS